MDYAEIVDADEVNCGLPATSPIRLSEAFGAFPVGGIVHGHARARNSQGLSKISLRSQRLHHVDPGCPRRGYHRRSDGGKQQHQSGTGHRQHARHFQTSQKSARQLRQPKPAGKPDSKSAYGHGRAFGDHPYQQMPRLRPDR